MCRVLVVPEGGERLLGFSQSLAYLRRLLRPRRHRRSELHLVERLAHPLHHAEPVERVRHVGFGIGHLHRARRVHRPKDLVDEGELGAQEVSVSESREDQYCDEQNISVL